MTLPILIAGPTASGKSALAIALAEALDGVVINADSQQVYREWRVLTARPSPADEARVPHRLYGHVGVAETYSVGRWLTDVRPVIAACRAEGRRPVIVGGTGLYFRALTDGLAPMPPVPPEIRARAERMGAEARAADLVRRDPETAAGIDMANPRRVQRAWEVLEATGRGLAAWQAETPPPLLPDAVRLRLLPDREALYARCDARLGAMIGDGVLDEVRQVATMSVPADAPGLRAVGAPEFLAHLRGESDLDAALASARTATRQYAKRQLTWVRNQMADWSALNTTGDTTGDGALATALGLVRATE